MHVSGSKVYLKPYTGQCNVSSGSIVTLEYNYRIFRIFQDSYAYKDVYAKVSDSYTTVKYTVGTIFRFF